MSSCWLYMPWCWINQSTGCQSITVYIVHKSLLAQTLGFPSDVAVDSRPGFCKNFSALAPNCVEQHGTFCQVKQYSTIIVLCYDLLVSRPDPSETRELAMLDLTSRLAVCSLSITTSTVKLPTKGCPIPLTLFTVVNLSSVVL